MYISSMISSCNNEKTHAYRSTFKHHQSITLLFKKSQIAHSDMHHPDFRINFLFHCVSLILIILLHTLLIRSISAHHHSHRSLLLLVSLQTQNRLFLHLNSSLHRPSPTIRLHSQSVEFSVVFLF